MLIPPLAISHEWYAPTLLGRLKHGEYPANPQPGNKRTQQMPGTNADSRFKGGAHA
ncbi:hypothetical protein [Pseudomonas sp. A6]|uniref:hypothetical protein n=1 Tax=Pseudomonas sp. A6 TaxID=410021 RepID=UPI0040263D88